MKKVAIVGCSDSKTLAPVGDPEFEIWGVNNLYHQGLARATRWFEIHSITELNGKWLRRGDPIFRGEVVTDYLRGLGEWAQKQTPATRVYMQRKNPLVPTSEEYPIADILKEFGGYFTNTISYEIALAIHEQFDEIHVYGVDMAVDTEYHWQRPSCEYMLGIAQGRGIKVYIPPQADLLKARFLYGFQEPEEFAWNKKLRSIEETMAQKRARVEAEHQKLTGVTRQLEGEIQQYLGAKGAIKEIKKIWG